MATPSLQPTTGSPTLRSIGALLAGILVGVILSLGTDMLMYALGVLPRLGTQPAGSNALLLAQDEVAFPLRASVSQLKGAFDAALLLSLHSRLTACEWPGAGAEPKGKQ